MELAYAIVWHDHDPEAWRWWCGVHEIYTDPETGTRHWSESPISLVAHGQEGGSAALQAEIKRILAEVSERPVLRTTDLMSAGGRALHNYGGNAPAVSAPPAPMARLAAE